MVSKPLVVITAGDPGGIGPEITVRALKHPRVRHACRALVFGDPGALLRAGWESGLGELRPVPARVRPVPGAVRAAQGLASFEAVRLGAKLAMEAEGIPLITAPVSKEAWALAGVPHIGHTDFLRRLVGAPRTAMMFAVSELRAALVTDHIPLRQVSAAISAAGVVGTAELVWRELKERLGLRLPRIAVCALNPHAGEKGMLGREEMELLAPAVRRLRRTMRVEGPVAADAAWALMRVHRYDALVTLYHDQALMPLKALSPFGVVHWTLGLPFVRTSPAHGTAFDIAGKGQADPTGMVEAILLAVRLVKGALGRRA